MVLLPKPKVLQTLKPPALKVASTTPM